MDKHTQILYNEIDPYAVKWLHHLMGKGFIPEGRIDAASIEELRDPPPVFHTFAGIGGWPYAMRLAGWPDATPVWTGSPPCQPFSVAGKRRGEDDDRHLWPWFRDLIAEHEPPVVFGEQVASPAGRRWFAAVQTDLETLAYRVAAVDLCAAGVGAPHVRQRLFWVALANSERRTGLRLQLRRRRQDQEMPQAPRSRPDGGVGDSNSSRREGYRLRGEERPDATTSGSGGVGNPNGNGSRGNGYLGPLAEEESPLQGIKAWRISHRNLTPGKGFWGKRDLLVCRDAKIRPVESGTFPLAYGVSGRVPVLRGLGNAIVPQVAAEFVKTVMEYIENEE